MQETQDKIGSHNPDAESAVLGSILIDPQALATIAEMLSPQDFYTDAHQILYVAALDLHGRSEPCDIVTLTDEIEQRGQLEQIGGADYITALPNRVPTSANAEYYAGIVKRCARERAEARLHQRYMDDIYNPQVDDAEAYERFKRGMDGIAEQHSRADDGYFLDLDQLLDQSPRTWPISEMVLDRTINTWIGDTGTYKSTLGLDVALTAARAGCGDSLPMCLGNIVQGGHAVYITSEGQAGIPDRVRGWLQYNKVDAEGRARIRHHFHYRRNAIPLLEQGNIDELLRQIRRCLPEGESLGYVFVDTLNMSLGGANENDPTDMGAVYGGLIRVKEETGAVVVVMHHVGKDGTPRGASAIPQNSDGIILLKKQDDKVQVNCFKQRDAAPFDPFSFSIKHVRETEDYASRIILCVPTRSDGSQATPQAKGPKGMAVRMIDALHTLGSATYSEWIKASGINQKTAEGLIPKLENDSYAQHEGLFYTLTAEGKKYVTLKLPLKDPEQGKSGSKNNPEIPSSPYRGEGIQGNDRVPMAAHAPGKSDAPHPQPDTMQPAQGDMIPDFGHVCANCGEYVDILVDTTRGYCRDCATSQAIIS